MKLYPARVSARLHLHDLKTIHEIARSLGLGPQEGAFTPVLRHLLNDWRRRCEGAS